MLQVHRMAITGLAVELLPALLAPISHRPLQKLQPALLAHLGQLLQARAPQLAQVRAWNFLVRPAEPVRA